MPRRTLSRVFIALLCLSCVAVVDARKRGHHDEVLRQAESSMLVAGTIDIAADGKVVGHALNEPKKVPPSIAAMIERLASQWRFEPVSLPNGAISRSDMDLLFVAKALEGDKYRIELRSANFSAKTPDEERLTIAHLRPAPEYPGDLAAMGVTGTVYVAVEVGRDGKIMNIDASHVNLTTIGSEKDMAQWREALTRASIDAVRRWTFAPPTAGEGANAPSWTGTLPISFGLYGMRRPKPYEWNAYLPGPRKVIPWLDSAGITADAIDAFAPNRLHSGKSGRRLIGPLSGG